MLLHGNVATPRDSSGQQFKALVTVTHLTPCIGGNNGQQRGEWLSGLYSLRQVTEVKLGRVRSDFGWVTSEA